MKAFLAALTAALAIGGAAAAQDDPDQSFTPGPPPANQPPISGDTGATTAPDGYDHGNPPPDDHGATGQFSTATIGDMLTIDELSGAWVGTWTRRPGTDTFDATWRNAQGQEAHDVIRLQGVSGNQVTFVRQGISGPAGGVYTGTISPDGRSIRGTASWYQPGWYWTAHLAGRAQPDGVITPHVDHGGEAQAETQLADTWNTGGCGFTDTALLDIAAPTRLTRLALWYNWAAGEQGVRYEMDSPQGRIGGGTLSRGSCDPYQGAWCEARAMPNLDLAPGRYQIRLERGALCQNGASSGQGFIRAWGYRTAGNWVEQESHPAISLTGAWYANDGGVYVIRQDGDRISWTGTSGDGGRSFLNDFQGRIEGDRIVGHFEDRPGHGAYSRGDLVLRIEGPNRIVMVTPSGGFGGTLWTR